MNEDLAVVKKYITYVVDNEITYKYPMCPQCVDSELPLYPWSDGDNTGLFCLMPNCNYKTLLGFESISRMKNDLKNWRVSLTENA